MAEKQTATFTGENPGKREPAEKLTACNDCRHQTQGNREFWECRASPKTRWDCHTGKRVLLNHEYCHHINTGKEPCIQFKAKDDDHTKTT